MVTSSNTSLLWIPLEQSRRSYCRGALISEVGSLGNFICIGILTVFCKICISMCLVVYKSNLFILNTLRPKSIIGVLISEVNLYTFILQWDHNWLFLL